MSTIETLQDDKTNIETKDLAELMLDSLNGYSLTAAEIVAALEVAKTTVIMDVMADMLAATRAEEFVKEVIGAEKKMAN